MSTVPGFPNLFESGCVLWNGEKCPYVIINKMQGTVLTKLNVNSLTPEIRLGIALQLLRLLGEAKAKLGPHFQHFDLHPDNIFVDLDHCADDDFVLDGIKFKCPNVSIIDFDLVHSDKFSGSSSFSKDLLPEQVAKLRGPVTIPERTINFTLKWLGPSKTSDLLGKLRLVKYTTDIRNWLAIFAVLVDGVDGGDFRICEDPIECIESNKRYFVKYLKSVAVVAKRAVDDFRRHYRHAGAVTRRKLDDFRRRARERLAAFDDDDIAEPLSVSLDEAARKFDVAFDYLRNFMRSADFAKDIREFFEESRAKSGYFPVIDNIATGISVRRDSPVKFRIATEDSDMLDISMKGLRISFLFKELKPIIYIYFDDFKIFFGTYKVLESILRSILEAIRTMGAKPIMSSLDDIFGRLDVVVEDGDIEEPTLRIRNLMLTFDGPFVKIKGTFEASRAYGYILSTSLRVKAAAERFGYLKDLGFDLVENADGSYTFSVKQSLEGPKHPCAEFAEHVDEYFAGDSARYDLCIRTLSGTVASITEPYIKYNEKIKTVSRGFVFQMFLEHLDEDYRILHAHEIDYKRHAFDFAKERFLDFARDRYFPSRYAAFVDIARTGRIGPLDVFNIVREWM
jgi:hypothetical protein